MKPILVSFELCPFVQRSVITLLEKKVDFDIRYIDLAKPPQWFLDISPFGKVPVLRVGDESLFESAVICEYLDEVNPPSMHPSDPLKKAINKSWIEFASELLMAQYRYSTAATEGKFQQCLNELQQRVAQLEAKLGAGPFLNGDKFCLIDAAFAPFFTRMALLETKMNSNTYQAAPKLARWAQQLVGRDTVIKSVKTDFAEKYLAYFASKDTYAAKILSQGSLT